MLAVSRQFLPQAGEHMERYNDSMGHACRGLVLAVRIVVAVISGPLPPGGHLISAQLQL